MEDSRGEEDTSCKAFGLMVARRGPLVCCCRAEWLSCALTSVLLPLSREATETRPCREQYRTNSDHVIKHGICLEASRKDGHPYWVLSHSFCKRCVWLHLSRNGGPIVSRQLSRGSQVQDAQPKCPCPATEATYVHAAVDQDLHLEILINAT